MQLWWLTKKLRHYFQSYRIQAVAKVDPMKYLCQSPTLVGKSSRWLLLLSEFDIEYVTKKVIKGRAVAEFLANRPIDSDYKEDLEFLDEQLNMVDTTERTWVMYFDGAINRRGDGLGVIITTP